MMRRRSSSDPAASGIKRHSSIKQNAGRPRRQTSPPRQPRPSRGKSMDSALMSGWRHIKGIMKITTLDESLHSKYGSADSKATNGSNRPEHITFKNIEIREYNRTVGDNPSVSSGPPVTISWEYNPNTLVLAVEEYEKSRPVRRTQSEMILPRSIRMEMLRKEWDVSRGQIAGAVRRGIRAKNQRRTTLGNLGKTEKVEEMIEGATKTLLKTLFLRKSTSKRAKELGEQIQKVNNQRAQIVLQHTMKGEYVETGIDESDSSSPWLAELMPDESETDHGASVSVATMTSSPEEQREQRREMPSPFRSSQSSGSNERDHRPKMPERPEPSDPDLDFSGSTSSFNEKQSRKHKQSTGESASQFTGANMRPAPITAVEPDDDDDFLSTVSGLTSAVQIDC